jgi:hypothetical protein
MMSAEFNSFAEPYEEPVHVPHAISKAPPGHHPANPRKVNVHRSPNGDESYDFVQPEKPYSTHDVVGGVELSIGWNKHIDSYTLIFPQYWVVTKQEVVTANTIELAQQTYQFALRLARKGVPLDQLIEKVEVHGKLMSEVEEF